MMVRTKPITGPRWVIGARIWAPISACVLTCVEFLVGQRAMLVQDRLADADLADVVQPAGDAHLVHRCFAESTGRGDPRSEFGNPGRMTLEMRVLRLEGVDQRLEGGDGQRPEGFPLLLQLRGARLHLVGGAPRPGAPLRAGCRGDARRRWTAWSRSTRSTGLTR